jgi:hypothetical protein
MPHLERTYGREANTRTERENNARIIQNLEMQVARSHNIPRLLYLTIVGGKIVYAWVG